MIKELNDAPEVIESDVGIFSSGAEKHIALSLKSRKKCTPAKGCLVYIQTQYVEQSSGCLLMTPERAVCLAKALIHYARGIDDSFV